MWPESAEVAERLERPDCQTAEEEITHQLQAYHRELQGLQDTYSNCMKTIDADQPHVDVFAQGENTFRFSPYSLICMFSWILSFHLFNRDWRIYFDSNFFVYYR